MAGWISVDRDMLESKLFSRSGNHVKICLYLLLSANHENRFHRGIEIKRGQCVRSFTQIEHACSVTRKAVRCAFENMIADEFIEVEEPFGARKGHRITICNYDTYQSSEHREGQVGAKEVPSKVHSKSHKQECKKEKKEDITLGASSDDATEEEFWMSADKKKITGKRLDAFKRLWEAFDYKKDRANAIKAFMAIPQLTDKMINTMCIKAEQTARARHEILMKGSTPIYLQGWITKRRWEDGDESEDFTPFRENGRNIAGEGLCNGLTRAEFIEKHGRVS